MKQTILSLGSAPMQSSVESPAITRAGSEDLPIVTSDLVKPKAPQRSYGALPTDSKSVIPADTPQIIKKRYIDLSENIDEDTLQKNELAERPSKQRVRSPPALATLTSHPPKNKSNVTSAKARLETVVSIPMASQEYYQQFQDYSILDYSILDEPTPIRSAKRGRERPRGKITGRITRPVSERDTVTLIDTPAQSPPRSRCRARGPVRAARQDAPADYYENPWKDFEPRKPRKPPKKRNNTAIRSRGRPRGRARLWYLFRELRPKYMEFACEWHGCPAKLFNMVTLRKHVEIVHVRKVEKELQKRKATVLVDGMLWCCWGTCCSPAAASNTTNPVTIHNGCKFTSVETLRRHIEEDHMVPYSWHMGDGPQHDPDNPGPRILDKNAPLPDYLFNENGVQVTPDIRGQQVESEASMKARKSRLKKLWIQVQNELVMEDDEESGVDKDEKMEDASGSNV